MAHATDLGLLDTTPAVDTLMVEGFRAMPGWRKLKQVRQLNNLGLALAMADIKARHPEAGERECLLRLASRCVDPTLLRDLCGWDLEREGY